jgi:hypothetical protein
MQKEVNPEHIAMAKANRVFDEPFGKYRIYADRYRFTIKGGAEVVDVESNACPYTNLQRAKTKCTLENP